MTVRSTITSSETTAVGLGKSARPWREHAGPALLLCAFTVALFVPVLNGKTFSMVGAHMYAQYPWHATAPYNPRVRGSGFFQTDHAETFYPLSVFATEAVRSGEFPMWLPYSFAGVPIVELGTTGLLYPPRLAAMLVLSPIRQHDFLLFTHLLAAALGMYALLRTWGADGLGAVLGAMVWQANGHNAFWFVMEHVAIAAAWLPLMFLAATLAVRRLSFRWAVAAGVAIGTALLAGSFHYVYLGAVILAAWYGAGAIAAAGRHHLVGDRVAARLCLLLPVCTALVAAIVGCAYWLPLLEWLPRVHRQPFLLQNQIDESASWGLLLKSLVSPWAARGPEPDYLSFSYTGLPALLMVAAAWLRRSSPVLLATILCAGSITLLLGMREGLVLLRSILPFADTMHLHVFSYTFCFGVSVLCAVGVTVLGRKMADLRAGTLIVSVFAIAIIGVEGFQLISSFRRISPTHPVDRQWLFPETPLITALGQDRSERALPVRERRKGGRWSEPVFAGKAAAALGIRSASGYESLLPEYIARLWRTVEVGGDPASDIPAAYRPDFFHDRLPLSLLARLSVGRLVTAPGVSPIDVSGRNLTTDGSLKLIYNGADGSIYDVGGALPRAYLVPRLVSVADESTALRTLIGPDFDPRRGAIVVGPDGAASQQPSEPLVEAMQSAARSEESARIVVDRINRVEVEVETPVREVLVFADSWASGWKAFVDGAEQPVLRVNYAFRGVAVPEGKHRVVFLYRPRLLLICMVISGFSLLIALAALVPHAVTRGMVFHRRL